MKDPEGSTDAGARRDGDTGSTDPALSSHTFTGSADRVALRVTPAHGDAPPGSVEVIDAASLPVGATAPQAEIVVRQLYPDTNVPATATRITPSRTQPPPPGILPPAHVQGRMHGMNGVSRRRVWFGIAAIIVVLLAIGFLALQSFGRSSNAKLPPASAPAIVGAPATPAAAPAPTLAPTPAPVPTAVPPASTLTTPTEAPLPTVTPTEAPSPTVVPAITLAPTVASTAAPITAPITVPTAVPPTSVPAAPPPPAVVPAATVLRPAIPPLPPGIQLPPTNIPPVPQGPRKPPVP